MRTPNIVDGNALPKAHSVKDFLVLVIVLSIPIWLVGGAKLPLPVNLPVSALTAFVPMIAAAILVFRRRGSKGMKELFQEARDYRNINHKVWYLPILFLAPFLYLISFVVIRLTGRPLPDPIQIPILWLPVFLLLYLISGAGEELGWTAYATEPMLNRWGVWAAGFLLGIIWAVWHSIAFVQTGSAMEWVIWQSVKTVATRMIIVWIYYKTEKSVFAAILYHTADNVSWSLFPNVSSHYDPLVTGLVNGAAILMIILIEKLTGFARSRAPQ